MSAPPFSQPAADRFSITSSARARFRDRGLHL